MSTSPLLPLSYQTAASLREYSLYDYMQADSRPTFMIASPPLKKNPSSTVNTLQTFYNASLSTNEVLLDRLTQVLNTCTPGKGRDHEEAVLFRSWVLGDAQSSICFCNTLWSSTDIDSKWRVVSGVQLPHLNTITSRSNDQRSEASPAVVKSSTTNGKSKLLAHKHDELTYVRLGNGGPLHPESLLSSIAEPTQHQIDMQSFDWTSTELGPVTTWPHSLYEAVKLALVCPLATLIYWGPSRIMLWNDPGIVMFRGFDGVVLGVSAFDVFGSFWGDKYELLCQEIERTGRALPPSRSPALLIDRDGGLRETFWAYNYMPLLDEDGAVGGIYAIIHDITAEVITEGRTDLLRTVNEVMDMATDLTSFWQIILATLEQNSSDVPLVAVYSIGSDAMVDNFTGPETANEWQRSSTTSPPNIQPEIKTWVLEGQIGFTNDHTCVPSEIAFGGTGCLPAAFRKAMSTSEIEDVLLSTADGTLPRDFFASCQNRGLDFKCEQLVVRPLQRPSGGVIAWLVIGVNPRRSFDDGYKRFTRQLSRYIDSKLVLVLTLEREKKMAMRSTQDAAAQRNQLILQLQQQSRELEQSRRRFFRFAEEARVGVYVLGGKGEIIFANDAWHRIFDVVPGTDGLKVWLERAHPDDIGELERQWNLCLNGVVQERFEFRVLRPGSTSFDSEDDMMYLESCCFPEMADDGTMRSVTGLLTDLSVHKAHQREETEKLKYALEAKRAQEYFMDMVSHEMRNPLNAIIQCTEEASQLIKLLKHKISVKDDTNNMFEDVEDMVNTILYCGAHQKQLIDDVLTLSKLDSNLLVVYPVEVDPTAVLNQVMKVFSSEIRSANIKVYTSFNNLNDSKGQSFTIMVDPSRIMQILINVVSNAIKFMKGRETRELHITTFISKEQQLDGAFHLFSSGTKRQDPTLAAEWGTGEPLYWRFSIQDTGLGLSDSEVSSLCSRFQQASPRTHVKYGGSGLGLFISRELTELHGGEIGMASQIDQGTTVVFYIKGRRCISQSGVEDSDSSSRPGADHEIEHFGINRKVPVTPPPIDTKPQRQPQSIPSLHVLVVEDNDVNRKVLRRQLEKSGFQVTTANHGGEALAVIKTSKWWVGDQKQDDNQLLESQIGRPTLSIILCDLEMPVMDGITCVRHIRQWQQEGRLHGDIPVVAVTGNARAQTTLDAAGFDCVISKPYSLKTLVEQILAHVKPVEDT